MAKKVFQILGILIVLFAAGLYVVINHSIVETNYRCTMIRGEPGTVFVKLQEFRPWVGLWSDTDGYIWVEEDGGALHFFSDLDISSTTVLIKGYESEAVVDGHWSKMSDRLTVGLAGRQFSGRCQLI